MESHFIEARIRYLTTVEGGRNSSVASGYRGQFYYGGNDYDGYQSFPDFNPGEYITLGTEVRAFIEFSKSRWDEVHSRSIYIGMPFEIREGSKKVGNGVVTQLDVSGAEPSIVSRG